MTAEQWLADLEAKATEAAQAEKRGLVCGWGNIADFREAASPEAVLRLVAMVRWLAGGCDCDAEMCMSGCTPECLLNMAYNATEKHNG